MTNEGFSAGIEPWGEGYPDFAALNPGYGTPLFAFWQLSARAENYRRKKT